MLVLAKLAAAVIAVAEPVAAGAIGGRFVSCAGGVAGVRVSVEGGSRSAVSDPTGAFELNDLPPGTFVLSIEGEGR